MAKTGSKRKEKGKPAPSRSDRKQLTPVAIRKSRWKSTVVRLFMQGYSHKEVLERASEIEKTKIPKAFIASAIDEALVDYAEANKDQITEYQASEVKKLNHLEREYWEAWERSLQPAKPGDPKPPGNHYFLQGIERVVKLRKEFLGHGNVMNGVPPQQTTAVQVNVTNEGAKTTTSTTIVRRVVFLKRETTVMEQTIEE
jgi:hypothetical protein